MSLLQQINFRIKSPFGQGLLSFILAALFMYAGTLKLSDTASFQSSINSFELVPLVLVSSLAFIIPSAEIVLAVMLLFPNWRQLAVWGVGLMTLIFLVVMASAMARGLVVDCGCFGKGDATRQSMIYGMMRNLLILGAVAWLLRSFREDGELPPISGLRSK